MTLLTKKTGRLLSGLTAAAALLTWMPVSGLTAAARTEQKLLGYYGDLDGDETVGVSDAVLLRDDLVQPGSVQLPSCWNLADLHEDEVLDARDLTMLKRLMLEQKEPRPFYQVTEVEEELISPPVLAVNPTLGSVGTQKILMVSVDFPDCKNERDYSVEEIHRMVFASESGEQSRAYPLESITAYYERASYGRLHLTGDVYKYTAKYPLKTYSKDTDTLVDEVMAEMDAQISYSMYDGNEDRVLDTFLLSLPAAANPDMDYDSPWWPCSYEYGGNKRFDQVKAGNICMGAWPLDDRAGFNDTWVHELGHAMGIPDYYYYENPIGDGDGLPGEAGFAMMDEAMGDMTAFDKLMYGWYETSDVHVYEGGTQTYVLESSQKTPGCILIPRGDLNGYLSEYFILEYITDTGNNERGFSGSYVYDMFEGSGVRILHCDAEVCNGWWGPEFKWNNYGKYYDSTNLRQRILRLVDPDHGLFRKGSKIDCAAAGFQWYDDDGRLTVDPGVTIEISDIANGKCTVTVQEGSCGQVAETWPVSGQTGGQTGGWPWGGGGWW